MISISYIQALKLSVWQMLMRVNTWELSTVMLIYIYIDMLDAEFSDWFMNRYFIFLSLLLCASGVWIRVISFPSSRLSVVENVALSSAAGAWKIDTMTYANMFYYSLAILSMYILCFTSQSKQKHFLFIVTKLRPDGTNILKSHTWLNSANAWCLNDSF